MLKLLLSSFTLLIATAFSVHAQSLASILERGSYLAMDVLSNDWVLSLIVFIVLNLLFYYIFLTSFSFIPMFNNETNPKGHTGAGKRH
ncbi:MAG: hypothetical protein ACOC32_02680, partial [Nanoarchaeota archaeon]